MGRWDLWLEIFGLPVADEIMRYEYLINLGEVNKEFHRLLMYVDHFGNLHSEGLIPNPNTFPQLTERESVTLLLNFRHLRTNFQSTSPSTFIYGHPVFRRPGEFCSGNQFWQGRWFLSPRY